DTGRVGGGRDGEAGRKVGGRVRVTEDDDRPGGPPGTPRGESRRTGSVREAQQPEPLRDSVPDPRREEAGDAQTSDRHLCGDAGAGQDDLLKPGRGPANGRHWRSESPPGRVVRKSHGG